MRGRRCFSNVALKGKLVYVGNVDLRKGETSSVTISHQNLLVVSPRAVPHQMGFCPSVWRSHPLQWQGPEEEEVSGRTAQERVHYQGESGKAPTQSGQHCLSAGCGWGWGLMAFLSKTRAGHSLARVQGISPSSSSENTTVYHICNGPRLWYYDN